MVFDVDFWTTCGANMQIGKLQSNGFLHRSQHLFTRSSYSVGVEALVKGIKNEID
jgi:hypothetical protein